MLDLTFLTTIIMCTHILIHTHSLILALIGISMHVGVQGHLLLFIYVTDVYITNIVVGGFM